MGDEETEIIQDTDSKLHVQKEVKEEVAEKDELKDNGEEKTENEIKAKQCEVTEQDELKDKGKTEKENKAKQKEVAEKDELKDNEEKTDTGNEEKQDESNGNEKEQSHNEEDTEKIRISKRSITITAKPPMLRGESRAQYMCQLARELNKEIKASQQKMNERIAHHKVICQTQLQVLPKLRIWLNLLCKYSIFLTCKYSFKLEFSSHVNNLV